jgi:hypothetical protein
MSRNGIMPPSNAPPASSSTAKKTEHHYSELPMITQHSEGESLQSCNFEGKPGIEKRCKSMNLNGGRGRNRTYNLSVKSRMLCQLSYASIGFSVVRRELLHDADQRICSANPSKE